MLREKQCVWGQHYRPQEIAQCLCSVTSRFSCALPEKKRGPANLFVGVESKSQERNEGRGKVKRDLERELASVKRLRQQLEAQAGGSQQQQQQQILRKGTKGKGGGSGAGMVGKGANSSNFAEYNAM